MTRKHYVANVATNITITLVLHGPSDFGESNGRRTHECETNDALTWRVGLAMYVFRFPLPMCGKTIIGNPFLPMATPISVRTFSCLNSRMIIPSLRNASITSISHDSPVESTLFTIALVTVYSALFLKICINEAFSETNMLV